MTEGSLAQKLQAVQETLQGFDEVIVAYSGGVDSTLLAALARDSLGRERVLAVTADSPSLAREDLADAVQTAQRLNLAHLVVQTHELSDPTYQANTPARCYACKHELFRSLEILAKARGIPVILYGAIGDDQLAERPGQQAALQHHVRAPLQEAGFSKSDVRELARRFGLPNWDRPQNACLASRIPHGREVTEEVLRQVEAAEAFLRRQGFRQVRVRHLGASARIEVEARDIARFEEGGLRRAVVDVFGQLGFSSVTVDRTGYRSGGADHHPEDLLPLR